MRWEELFADLEGQLAAVAWQEVEAQVAEQTRVERAQVTFADRVAASQGREISIATAAGPVHGRLADLGKDWMLLEETGRRGALIPVAAVTSAVGLVDRSDAHASPGRRFGLSIALRGISRDRAPVAIHDVCGGLATGTIDRVGADHLELTEHPADAVRRSPEVTGRRVIRFAAIAVARRA